MSGNILVSNTNKRKNVDPKTFMSLVFNSSKKNIKFSLRPNSFTVEIVYGKPRDELEKLKFCVTNGWMTVACKDLSPNFACNIKRFYAN